MYKVLQKIGRTELLLWNRDSIKESTPPAHRLYLNVPLGSKKIFIFFPLWSLFCLWHLFKLRPTIIHACDLEGVIPAYLYTRIHRHTKIVFDIFDVSAGKYDLPKRSVIRNLFLKMDRFMIRHSARVFIPDPQRLDQLCLSKKELARIQPKFRVIYNSDLIVPGRHTIHVKGEKLAVAYVGNLTKNIRGIEFLLEAARSLPDVHFNIAGMGADLDYFSRQFVDANLPNLTFYGRVDHAQAMRINHSADIMISLLNPEFSNYKYASSTKIFEAFRLFKPLIVTQDTATASIVEQAQWGLAIPYAAQNLIDTLTNLQKHGHTFALDAKHVEQLGWQRMERHIIKTYEQLV